MHIGDLNDCAPLRLRRAADRSLAAGVLVSLAVHTTLALVLLSAMRDGAPVVRRPVVTGVIVALLPDSDAATAVAASVLPASLATLSDGRDAAAPSPAIIPQLASVRVSAVAETAAFGSGRGEMPAAVAGASGLPVGAGQPPTVDPAAGSDYRRRLLEHIAGYVRPTPGTPNGVVTVRFTIARGGEVLAASVVGSSGEAALDDEAVAAVWRAEPMPSIPPVLPERLIITLPLVFRPVARLAG